MAEITDKTRADRADAIEGLRHLVDLFEANPALPIPQVSWVAFHYHKTQAERFAELHDVADALGGAPVMEAPETGDRTMRFRIGALAYYALAEADRPKSEPKAVPRPVQRPVHADGEQPS